MKLSIVIVNYNVKYYLHQCLMSVEKAMRDFTCDVVVVDNCSSDGSVEFLRKMHPCVRFIENSENQGYACANNIAIRESNSDYVLLLNPDTIITEETLASCLAFMDEHPKAGVLGLKMLKENGTFALESRRGVPTPSTAFYKMCGLTSLFPKSRMFGKYYMQYLDKEEVNRIEIVSGAFAFLRRQCLNETGYLDEDFFMYGEDIDLSYRILKRGWENYYLPTPILHYKGESTQKSSYRYVYRFYNAMLIFFNKHYGHYSILFSLPVKGAILAKGCMEYIHMKLHKCKSIKNEQDKYLRKHQCVYVGNATDYEAVSGIMTNKVADIRHIEYSDQDSVEVQANRIMTLLSSSCLSYVVVNIEDCNIGQTLVLMQQMANYVEALPRKQRKHVSIPKLATYMPSLQKVITSKHIFE